MRFTGKISIGGAPQPETARAARVFGYPCADLAPIYGKAGGLSPFRRVFWASLAAPRLELPGGPEIGPPRLRQRLGLGLPPRRDPGVVAGKQDFWDRPALELLRAGILWVFQ